jgi:hypothetical protein
MTATALRIVRAPFHEGVNPQRQAKTATTGAPFSAVTIGAVGPFVVEISVSDPLGLIPLLRVSPLLIQVSDPEGQTPGIQTNSGAILGQGARVVTSTCRSALPRFSTRHVLVETTRPQNFLSGVRTSAKCRCRRAAHWVGISQTGHRPRAEDPGCRGLDPRNCGNSRDPLGRQDLLTAGSSETRSKARPRMTLKNGQLS